MTSQPTLATPRPMKAAREVIVLIHGIWTQGVVMQVMAQQLGRRGFRTRTVSYDFLSLAPAANADALALEIAALDADVVHIVAHSLGGIVTLHLLDRHPELPIGKVVMLGSPARGSRVARRVHANRLLRPLLGRSTEAGLLGGAPAWSGRRPLGVINGSGKLGFGGLFFPAEEENSDGVVDATETLEDVADDHVTVPRSHSMMLFSRSCADYVASFVRTGRFSPATVARG